MKLAAALALLLTPLAIGAQGMNLKIGAWEMTHRGSGLPGPMVEKTCVTKADLAQFASGPDKEDDSDCKYVKPPITTGNRWIGDKQCTDGRKVRAEIVAETPERVKGTFTASNPRGGPAMVLETSGRWLGASCAGIN